MTTFSTTTPDAARLDGRYVLAQHWLCWTCKVIHGRGRGRDTRKRISERRTGSRTVPALALALLALACEAPQTFQDQVAHVTREPERAVCGWVEGQNPIKQVPETEPGLCLLLDPGPDWAISSPDAGPCDVTPGPKVVRGGAFVGQWIRWGAADGVEDEWTSEVVPCQ